MNSILITGTNRGIGLGLVKAFVNGETVPKHIIATCRKPEEAFKLQELAEKHKNINILKFDVQQYTTYDEFVKNVTNIVENEGLNLLINNAGISHKFGRIGLLKYEQMIQAYDINCLAPIFLVKALLPLLKTAAEKNKTQPIGSQRAAVVNISSILGSIAENDVGGFYSYRCSKTALNAATRSLSIDLKPYNIVVTSLHPGWVKTDIGGPKAPLEIDEATKTLADLIKNISTIHNGQFYSYNGSELKW